MQKLTYTTPTMEITKWETKDIITTSGTESIVVNSSAVSMLGDSNVTSSVDYGNLK